MAESASAAEIKAAYRAKALKVHPDVSSAPDATEKFAELSHAYGESGVIGATVLQTVHTGLWSQGFAKLN